MKNKKRWGILIFMAFLAVGVCGCQLAQKDSAEDIPSEKLYGVFSVIEQQDLKGKIEGKIDEKGMVSFDNVYGYQLRMKKDKDMWSSEASQEMIDVGLNVHKKDEKEEWNVEGTLYIASKQKTFRAWLYPIYQKKDGSVYLDAEKGATAAFEDLRNGASSSLSISNDNGTEKYQYKVNYKGIDTLCSVDVLEMNAENQLIKKSDSVDMKEQTMVLQKNTNYIIINEHWKKRDGNTYIKKKIYQWKKGLIYQRYYAAKDGVVLIRDLKFKK